MWAVESMWCNKDRTSSKVRILKLTESENQYRQYDVLLRMSIKIRIPYNKN